MVSKSCNREKRMEKYGMMSYSIKRDLVMRKKMIVFLPEAITDDN